MAGSGGAEGGDPLDGPALRQILHERAAQRARLMYPASR